MDHVALRAERFRMAGVKIAPEPTIRGEGRPLGRPRARRLSLQSKELTRSVRRRQQPGGWPQNARLENEASRHQFPGLRRIELLQRGFPHQRLSRRLDEDGLRARLILLSPHGQSNGSQNSSSRPAGGNPSRRARHKAEELDLGNEAQWPGAIADICFGLPREAPSLRCLLPSLRAEKPVEPMVAAEETRIGIRRHRPLPMSARMAA